MEDTELELVEFTAHDRCDRCQAQAYTLAQSEHGELLFCAHHSKKYRDILMDEGWIIMDDVSGLETLSPMHPLMV